MKYFLSKYFYFLSVIIYPAFIFAAAGEDAAHYQRSLQKQRVQAEKNLYLDGKCSLEERKKILKFMGNAADEGDCEAQSFCSRLYIHGIGCDKDFFLARHYLELAAAQKDLESLVNLGVLLEKGLGGDQDLPRARLLYQEASEKGHITGQRNYAWMCHEGLGGEPQDDAKARHFFGLAANHSGRSDVLADSQYKYGVFLANGQGGPKDIAEAERYFKLAADQNHMEAQYNYCVLVIPKVDQNNEQDLLRQLVHYLISATKQGHKGAHNLLQGIRLVNAQ